ncbi:MAG TPA: hypothetical protein V6D06_06025 [Trichocoleus sp.]
MSTVFAHLGNQGANVWRELDDLLRNPDPISALEASVREAGEERFLQTWPMGLAREAGWGGDWDATGPSITDHRLRPTSIGSVPTDIVFNAATPGLAETQVPMAASSRFALAPTERSIGVAMGEQQRRSAQDFRGDIALASRAAAATAALPLGLNR